MKNTQDPHLEPIIVAPLHYPKTPRSLKGLTAEKEKAAADSDLFNGKKFKAPTNALLTYRGGLLLLNVQVYTIFWGKKWATDATLKTTVQSINSFYNAILTSPLIDQLAEYSVPGQAIGHGSLIGTQMIATSAPTVSVSDTTIRLSLQKWISSAVVPVNSLNTLYFIYLEPNIKVTMGGSASCTSFCGYHNNIGNILFYAAMPYPSCSGCLGGLPAIDALTGTSSHELCEAITDPIPGSGWYDTHNGEIGDICAWSFKRGNGFVVQNEWSNASKACV